MPFKNPAAGRANKRAYHVANRERILARKRAYYEANREKMCARNNAYGAANREKIRAAERTRRKNNPEKMHLRECSPKRRFNQLKNGARRRGLSVTFDFAWYEKRMKGEACYYCAGDLPETGHGLDRKDSKLGYSPENCVPCCKACNEIRGHDNVSYSEMLIVAKVLRELRTRQ
jgi:hypothetical protein